jgi:hypothetical protein
MFFFGPQNIGLLPKYSIFLASSQLTMNIQWLCYYVVIHICDNVLSSWVEINSSFYLISLFQLEIQLSRGVGLVSH